MKQRKKSVILILLISFLLSFSLPKEIRGESAGMQNDVGIGFENDYEPTETPTEDSDLPAGSTDGSGTGNVPNIKKPNYPATGEKRTKLASMGGITVLIGLSMILWYRKKKNQ